MLLNRAVYAAMLTKLAAEGGKDDPHKIDSGKVSQEEHTDNKKDVKSDLHELFDEAKKVGKQDTALLKKTLPRGDRETSNPLVKVATDLFYSMVPKTLFLKEAGLAYFGAMERGFLEELEKIATIVGRTRPSYAGAPAPSIPQMGRMGNDPASVAQFHEITRDVAPAAGPGPVGQSQGAMAHSQAAAQKNWEATQAQRRAAVAANPVKTDVSALAQARQLGTGTATKATPAAEGLGSKIMGGLKGFAKKLKMPGGMKVPVPA